MDGPTDDLKDGVFKSTVHRAVNRSGVERYSMPLFFGTDYDVELVVSMCSTILAQSTRGFLTMSSKPIPSCVSEDRPAKYSVVTAGDHVKERLKATYGHAHDKQMS